MYFKTINVWRTRTLGDVEWLLENPATWYLTDALLQSPEEAKAVTIMVSSPSEKYYSEFLKYSHVAPLHYLPVWSLDELKFVAPSYQRGIEEVEERYDVIGGLSRYVLEKKVDLVELIARLIEKLDLNRFVPIALGEVSKEDQPRHRIVHFKAKTPLYWRRTLTRASN
jgi:hypothetical protein